jgi:anti-sigma regulatory factor (Ser/Thr protein kinase)
MAGQELGSIEAAASMENWDKINDFISELIGQSIANASRGYKLRLASEELVSNIIRAAGELNSGEDKDISLQISARLEQENGKSWFVVKTADNGQHFDPHFGRRNPVDTEQHIREREIGGLGLFLIEQSVDKATYDWVDEYNIYELWVDIDADQEQGK